MKKDKNIPIAGEKYIYIGTALFPTTEKTYIVKNKTQLAIYNLIQLALGFWE